MKIEGIDILTRISLREMGIMKHRAIAIAFDTVHRSVLDLHQVSCTCSPVNNHVPGHKRRYRPFVLPRDERVCAWQCLGWASRYNETSDAVECAVAIPDFYRARPVASFGRCD